MATSYNTTSGGQGVKLTDKQYASLSPDLQKKYSPTAEPTPSAISTPAPTPKAVSAPSLPTPTAPQTQESYFLSSADQIKLARTSLDDAYKSQSAQLDDKIANSEMAIANLSGKQQNILDNDVERLVQPFREDFEKSERERLKVEQNYFKNQSLANELEGLLNEGNVLIAQQKGQPVGQQILNKRLNKTISDISARTGVIEAVMAARNSQIGQAYNLIDRSVKAMTADRQDQLSYFETILDFYQNAKDEEGKKLFKLEGDKQSLINEQIGLIKHDLDQAEANAQHIKDLMQDPDTASFMAQAGVTLNDTPDVVNQKMAAQAQRQEIEATKNELTSKGYEFVPFATGAAGEQTYMIGGKPMTFKPGAQLQQELDLDNQAKRTSIAASQQSILNSQQNRLVQLAQLGDAGALAKLGITTEPGTGIRLDPEKAASLQKEMTQNPAYQAVKKSQDSIQALKAYERLFKSVGTTSGVTSPIDNAKLKTAYNTATLNLKEFFNLGVLNGPDLSIIEGVLGKPTDQGLVTSISAKSGANEGLKNMYAQLEQNLDDRYLGIRAQYGQYDPNQLGLLQDLDRVYLQNKAAVNPAVAQFLAENPNLPLADKIQVINTKF